MSNSALGSTLVTAASSGIGATYTNCPARRDYDLVQVARNKDQLETNASRLRSRAGIAVEVVRRDGSVGLSADDAGALVPSGLADPGRSTPPRVFAHGREQ